MKITKNIMREFKELYDPEVDDCFDALDSEYLSIEQLIEKEATSDCEVDCCDCPNFPYCPYVKEVLKEYDC